jgi:hypothetical protein
VSLSVFNPLPDQQRQIDELTRNLRASEERAARAESELRDERARNIGIEAGVSELRTILMPLYQGLGRIFGEMAGIGVDASQPSTKNNPAWEQWKERLGGATARAIDALMVHGEMNQTQLRIILGCATRTVTNVVAALNQAKLIDKRDGKIRLKEL